MQALSESVARPFQLLCTVAIGWALASGCDAGDSSVDTAGTGGAAGAAGSGEAGDDAGLFAPDAPDGSGGTSLGDGEGCVGDSFEAEPFPLDIFVMLDQSGSMSQDAGNLLTRWQTIKSALTKFVQQPSAAGIGIGIQFFGLPDPSVHGCSQQTCTTDADCTGGCSTCVPQGVCESPFNPDIDSCDPIDYAWAYVAIQLLPGAGSAIIAAMSAHSPGTNTPIEPALGGAIQYARQWADAHLDHITVVTFATDGGPSECNTDMSFIAGIAADGFNQLPSIKTFVVGVGDAPQNVDLIAAAGGTVAAFHVDTDPTAEQQFLDALNAIRLEAIACTYEIPPPPAGKNEDFSRVNVEYTPGNGDPSEAFAYVETKADCPATTDGWYYDDVAAPTKILLCPSSCDKISADVAAHMDIVLGCEAIVR